MKNKIYDMLEKIKPEHDFKSSDDFIEDGLLDSFDIITLISMAEEEYNVTIDGLDIVPENFNSVDVIISLIKKSESNT